MDMCKNGRNSPTTETPKFLFFTESHMDLSNAHACQCSHTAGHPWRTPCSWPTKGSVQIAGPRSRRRVFCFKSSNVMIIGLGFTQVRCCQDASRVVQFGVRCRVLQYFYATTPKLADLNFTSVVFQAMPCRYAIFRPCKLGPASLDIPYE